MIRSSYGLVMLVMVLTVVLAVLAVLVVVVVLVVAVLVALVVLVVVVASTPIGAITRVVDLAAWRTRTGAFMFRSCFLPPMSSSSKPSALPSAVVAVVCPPCTRLISWAPCRWRPLPGPVSIPH